MCASVQPSRAVPEVPALLRAQQQAAASPSPASDELGVLKRELERRDRELAALEALVRVCAEQREQPHLPTTLAGVLAGVLDFDGCALWLAESSSRTASGVPWFVRRSSGSWRRGRPPRYAELLARAALRNQQLLVSGPPAEGAWDAEPERARPRRPHAYAVLPLINSDGALGALALFRYRAAHFTEHELRFLAVSGRQLAAGLTSLRHVKAAQREAQALAEVNEQLQELNALKSEFVSLVSHELRTPLAGISAHAWMLTDYWERLSEEQRRQSIQSIRHRTHRLEQLITDLLTLSRVEAGRPIEVTPESVEVRPMVEYVIAALGEAHGGRVIELHLPDDLPAVLADKARVEQVLTNLIDNALKFSPRDSTVQVRASSDEAEVAIQVIDRGPGIGADDLPRLFQRFGRLSSEDGAARPGTGIGLYLSRLLVEAQGGRIWVDTQIGGGSTFTFTLPRADTRGG